MTMTSAKVGDYYRFEYEGRDAKFNCTLQVVRVLGDGPDDLVFFEDLTHSKQKNLVSVAKGATCDFCAAHDSATDTPTGNRCGTPATHRIEWADGRFSLGCDAHLAIDEAASVRPSRIISLKESQ